jgi:hypothetical protein
MKFKIKVLNFVLWLLGLTTETTGLVTRSGKRFELFSYQVKFTDIERKSTHIKMVEKVEETINSNIGEFLKHNSLVEYIVDPRKEIGISCTGTVLIFKVKD